MTNIKTTKLPNWIQLPYSVNSQHIISGMKNEQKKLVVLKMINGKFLILKAYNWYTIYPNTEMRKGRFSNAEYTLSNLEMIEIKAIITKLQ